MNGGNINAYMSGRIVSISFFCNLSGLPCNGEAAKKIISGLPEPIGYTLGFIAAQYADPAYVARFYIETNGCLYVENKSDHNASTDWVVGSITYIAK